MKTFIAFALLIVSIAGLPQKPRKLVIEGIYQKDERLVSGAIEDAIEDASQAIRDAGLDPLHIMQEGGKYALPVPVLFNIQAELEELLLTGLSNIVVHDINYSLISNRLTFDIRLPLIELNLRKAATDIVFFGRETESSISGRLAIVGIRLDGNIRVSIGIISGISIRSIDLDFSLGGIESNLQIRSHGKDFSEPINQYLGVTIPSTLDEFSKEINELLEIVVTDIVEANL